MPQISMIQPQAVMSKTRKPALWGVILVLPIVRSGPERREPPEEHHQVPGKPIHPAMLREFIAASREWMR